MRLKNKNILVYGIGKSGLATIEFLKQKKANIYCYDDNVKKFINGVVWIDENQNVDFLDFAVGQKVEGIETARSHGTGESPLGTPLMN